MCKASPGDGVPAHVGVSENSRCVASCDEAIGNVLCCLRCDEKVTGDDDEITLKQFYVSPRAISPKKVVALAARCCA